MRSNFFETTWLVVFSVDLKEKALEMFQDVDVFQVNVTFEALNEDTVSKNSEFVFFKTWSDFFKFSTKI